ncbi:hypothetical protein [Actinotalea sp. K2]|uniref:hypothetical protein n=1 Tax=Actinotalea sp. K2 TaxID=2939438 RepID=UPI002017599B|nr:hypothetical protein [Actinotalea sp. K2]MCL3860659.1 hypothetical protein [Actinotalea sp. K2]
MARFRRSPQLPDDVRARLDLVRGDKVLGIGELVDGWAVATTRALHVVPAPAPAPDGGAHPGQAAFRRPWADVDHAGLDAEAATLSVTWVDGSEPTVLHLADVTSVELSRAVHGQVQSSVVHSEKVTLTDGTVVRVALRRTADGEIISQVIGPGTVDLGDPTTAGLVDAAEARVREAAGLR